ncbi:hypothetical protein [Burkholderia ambifaria]|uniref:hypothetical protein n=1 Tax=Burkholderia ambifaria TaxID=152480 RepID=UPI00158BB61C|nr:hypothetical protein [Burkholderia ambifaria]
MTDITSEMFVARIARRRFFDMQTLCRGRGASCRWLPRYIPETKQATPDDMSGLADGMRRATVDGITHGMPLAVLDAPASGRSDATRMARGHLVNKALGDTMMKTRSHDLIRAFLAHPWSSRAACRTTRDAVRATRVHRCRFPGIRVVRVLERLSFRTTTCGQRCAPSSGWATLFVPVSMTPIPLRSYRAVSIAPDTYRRWLD